MNWGIVIVVILLIILIWAMTRQKKHYKELMRGGAAPEIVEMEFNNIENPDPIDKAYRANNLRILAEQRDEPAERLTFISMAGAIVEELIGGEDFNDVEMDDAYMLVQLAGTFPQINPPILNTEDILAGTSTKGEAADKIIETFRPVLSDSQNVHDTTFNTEIKNKINRLMGASASLLPELAIDEAIQAGGNRRVLDTISEKYTFGDIPENEIFAAVWSRGNTLDKRKAILAALDDCIENGEVVCTSGRVGRIVESLTMMDPIIGDPIMTGDMYKNQIFSEVKDLMRSAPLLTGSENIKLVAASYDDPSIEVTPAAEEEFREFMTKKIDEHLEKYKPPKLTQTMFNFIRDGCLAAII